MNNRILILITIVFVIAGLTYLWSSPAEQQSEADRSPELKVDTTSKSDRPSFEASKDTTVRQPVGEDLSPGTAVVQFIVDNIEYDGEQPNFITGQVNEVLGYGSATSVINPSTNMTLNVSEFFGTERDDHIDIAKGDTVVIKLSESKGMVKMNGSDKDLNWRIKDFIK